MEYCRVVLEEIDVEAILRCKPGLCVGDELAFAQREDITYVIFGRTARTRWEILMKGSTLARFLQWVREAAIQVLPLGERGG